MTNYPSAVFHSSLWGHCHWLRQSENKQKQYDCAVRMVFFKINEILED